MQCKEYYATRKQRQLADVQVRELLQAMQEEMNQDAERDEAVHDKQATAMSSFLSETMVGVRPRGLLVQF